MPIPGVAREGLGALRARGAAVSVGHRRGEVGGAGPEGADLRSEALRDARSANKRVPAMRRRRPNARVQLRSGRAEAVDSAGTPCGFLACDDSLGHRRSRLLVADVAADLQQIPIRIAAVYRHDRAAGAGACHGALHDRDTAGVQVR